MAHAPSPPCRRRLRLIGGAAFVFALAGCYMPQAQQHAELRIAADGSYRFNGQPVDGTALAAAIAAAKRPQADLVVQIDASSSADVAAVQRAVAAVKAAQGRVAFAGRAG